MRNTTSQKIEHIKQVLVRGDMSLMLLFAGLGLILWAAFGMFMYVGDLNAYASMFPFGNGMFWVLNYTACGLALWYLVAAKFPPVASLVTGAWICVIWGWSAFARMTETATQQTGNATSVIYILIGLMLIQRTGK